VFSFPEKGDREFSQYSCAVHDSNEGESMKKYTKPVLIDLSIEGMTGIGAGIMSTACEIGGRFSEGSVTCEGGTLAGSSCSLGFHDGYSCGNGYGPTVSGVVCAQGSTAESLCSQGQTASGRKASCLTLGNTATAACSPQGITASTKPPCTSGSAPSICYIGNTDSLTS
jgi:hypothetical protein